MDVGPTPPSGLMRTFYKRRCRKWCCQWLPHRDDYLMARRVGRGTRLTAGKNRARSGSVRCPAGLSSASAGCGSREAKTGRG